MRCALIVACVVGAGCAREPAKAAELVPVTNHQLPSWTPLPPPNTKIAKPVAWVADGRPTLFLFSASWCPTCPASLLTDIAIARAYGDRFQVGVGLVDNADEDFVRAPMARLLADVPVWNADSVKAIARRCGAASIPLACIVDRDRVVFRGSVGHARHLLDAHAAGTLEAKLVADAASSVRALARVANGFDEDDIPDLVLATHHDPKLQNGIALRLASRKEPAGADIALAVALARDAVASDGGLDYSHLDTYSLALSKANLPDEAAAVSWRVLHVCRTVHGECMIEKRRAYLYIYYARERVK